LLVAWAGSIGYFDARYRRIPNVLSLGAWCVAVALLLLRHTSLTGADWPHALLAGGLALLLTLPGYAWRKLGAGDVKYLVAIGLLTSVSVTLTCFVVTAFAGGLIAVAWLLLQQMAPFIPAVVTKGNERLASWLVKPARERRMPYGTLMTLGLYTALWMDSRA
jgi:prepilin peptidase CpaA